VQLENIWACFYSGILIGWSGQWGALNPSRRKFTPSAKELYYRYFVRLCFKLALRDQKFGCSLLRGKCSMFRVNQRSTFGFGRKKISHSLSSLHVHPFLEPVSRVDQVILLPSCWRLQPVFNSKYSWSRFVFSLTDILGYVETFEVPCVVIFHVAVKEIPRTCGRWNIPSLWIICREIGIWMLLNHRCRKPIDTAEKSMPQFRWEHGDCPDEGRWFRIEKSRW
jgi:hypothetical protein